MAESKDSTLDSKMNGLSVDSKDSTATTTPALSTPAQGSSATTLDQGSTEAETPAQLDGTAQRRTEPTKIDGPVRTPFTQPPAASKRPTPATLTPDQQTKYDSVLAAVTAWTSIPVSVAKGAASEPLSESEQMWLTRECLLRYLRATTWTVPKAVQRLKDTLVWRREYGTEKLTADHISPEMETGKEVILGYDVACRPCVYLNPGKQNTPKSDRQIQGLVFMLERGIEMMVPGQETMALLINYRGSTTGNSPSVAQGRQTLTILQGHYPERLGKACVSDLPWYITTFFKLISPFIDPVTKSKIVFNEPLGDKYVPKEQLWKDYGGAADFEYEHAQYWPAMNKLCEQRRADYRSRWEAAGKRIGEYEGYLQGGEQKPLKEVETSATS